jgi:hypothetical protein
MLKTHLPLVLVLVLALLAVVVCTCAYAVPTTTPTSAAVKVAADPMMPTAEVVPSFRDGSAVSAATFACAATPPAVAMDATTKALLGANLTTGTTPTPSAAARGDTTTLWNTVAISATLIVACSSPPALAGTAVHTDTALAAADSPPRHEVAIARMDYGRCTQS